MFQKILFFLIIFCFGLLCLKAQTQTAESSSAKPARLKMPTRLLEIGAGPTAYRGDLANGYDKWSAAVHIGLKFNRKHRLNGHLNLAIGTVTGQNRTYVFAGESEITPTPNRYFKTSFFSVNYDIHVNLIKTSHWIVYVSQGVGLLRFNPRDEYGGSFQGQLTTRQANETYGNITLMLPTQVGALYLLPNGYGAGIQAGWVNSQTDYLDNISQWGNRSKKDNMFWAKLRFIVPLSMKNE